jgi:acyl carrier protein
MKTLDEFVGLFAEQFDDTDVSEITATSVFHDLDEWSSLIGLSVIAMVDEEFEVALKGDDIRTSVTVEDLYNKVIAKL